MKFYPNRGAEKVLAMLKGGGGAQQVLVLTLEFKVLAILMGGGA